MSEFFPPYALPEKPNVMLISVDQWAGAALGCAGHPAILTPTLDQLATNGTRFANAYSECPVCIPARRTLMTGLTPQSHGMLANQLKAMPETPTIAEAFRDGGYQTYAVGKMHWAPQRIRRGFDDILLDEEGRGGEGCRVDDYEMFLGEQGHPGERFAGGMCNNNYMWRPWHLEEPLHCTNWTAREMCKQIIRRDPRRPAFWYTSFSHPHPPLTPLQAYLDIYRDHDIPDPIIGDWIRGDIEKLPTALQRDLQKIQDSCEDFSPGQIRDIRRAYYAQCTHIDHQIRTIIGTLREEGILGHTILCFLADHGEMLGNHRLWAKHWMNEDSAHVPMILVGTAEQQKQGRVQHHHVDDRLVGLADVMPTLLDLAGVPIPEHCEGLSMVGSATRSHFLGAQGDPKDQANPTRMIRDASHKLIYYPVGNLFQLFDMRTDRQELHDLAGDPAQAEVQQRLTETLLAALPAEDREAFAPDSVFTGWPDAETATPSPNSWFSGQRGLQWPNR